MRRLFSPLLFAAVALLLSITPGSCLASDISLAWDPEAYQNTAGYRLHSGTTSGVYTQITDLGNTAAASVSNLVDGQTYFFAVTAYSTTGVESTPSNEISYMGGAPTPTPTPTPTATPTPTPKPTPKPTPTPAPTATPRAPSNLSAAAASSSKINLSWTDNSTNETGFKIERSTNGTSFTQITTVASNATAYANTGLTASTKYYYRVRAYNSSGNSSYSNGASATTAASSTPTPTPTPSPASKPAPPTNLIAAAASLTQINLSWTDNSSNETGFKIQRSTTGSKFKQIGTVGANVTVYASTGLTASKKYYYRVRAYNSIGSSNFSNTASATTAASSTPTPTPTPTPSVSPTPTPTPTPTPSSSPTPTPTPTTTPTPSPTGSVQILSPALGSTFTSSSVTFSWSAGSATAYCLLVGSSLYGSDIYNSGQVHVLSATVNNIPTNGRIIYVTLLSFANNSWSMPSYTYKASN